MFERIDSGEVEITGTDGPLPALLKEWPLERGLAAELTDHLELREGRVGSSGASQHDEAGPRPRTVDPEVGPFETGGPRPGGLVHPAAGSTRDSAGPDPRPPRGGLHRRPSRTRLPRLHRRRHPPTLRTTAPPRHLTPAGGKASYEFRVPCPCGGALHGDRAGLDLTPGGPGARWSKKRLSLGRIQGLSGCVVQNASESARIHPDPAKFA